ncbi:hypothetical protein ZYGR_0E01580 [Zygosaccharomyces rouxii]|uniref:ZYRO0B03520p n=2 Tax=Zygosaccharomyces rouxii TaxID=4956 RepID=C5DQW4_ZYGRC|nr:uncharacterized protein ZYRO0B03520g [Zygosaccharomyces rouxii]KAH9200276.1 hypothetical protein LQ764DRAFT_114289 [Zygosaccharomyces rouxii]GAV47143.1 hypothetical protein ZYGR_0E01580 [Zygosaccharomyces rouxii]CAR26175.1 ZYRO0B03520p [Zygosaccharomyces rouxii]
MVDPNPNSSPPRFSIGSSPGPLPPTRAVQRWSDSEEGIADDIFSYRKGQYADAFPSYSSSPIRSRRKHNEVQNRKVAQRRVAHRDNSTVKVRGGNEEMEKFVMTSERERELRRLKLQAEEHAIRMDEVEKFEKEQREEIEDEELLDYVEKREQCEKELEQMLADLLIT